MEKRRQAAHEESWAALEPFLKDVQDSYLVKKFPVGPERMLDIGSEDGYLTRKYAELFNAHQIDLVDLKKDKYLVSAEHMQHHVFDVVSPEFREWAQWQYDLVVSLKSLHEMSNAHVAVFNSINALRHGGFAIFLDFSEEWWSRNLAMVQNGTLTKRHYTDDQATTTKNGLRSDGGIRSFWSYVNERVPGQLQLTFYQGSYAVLYEAADWGQVKPMPKVK
jgi:SAM-dependent methyltransferase